MKNRAPLRLPVVLAILLLLAACIPSAAPTATPTTRPLPTRSAAPTATALPTRTALPSPTRPDRVQLVSEIALHTLPAVGHNPQALVEMNGRVYVANRATDNVSVIEGDRVSAVIAVGDAPTAIAADPETQMVYVVNEGDSTISFLSGGRIVRVVSAPSSPACIVALEGRLYVGARDRDALAVLDGVSGERLATVAIDAPIGVLALAVSRAAGLLYASAYDSVQFVDLQTLQAVGELRHSIYTTLGADPSSRRFFIGDYDSATNTSYLLAYDSRGPETLQRVAIGGDPRGVAVDPERGRIYVANSWTNDLSVIDASTFQVIATIAVGLRPLAVAVGEDGIVYVSNADSDNVAVIDGRNGRLQKVIPLSPLPGSMAVSSATGRLYVPNASANSVLMIENHRLSAEVAVGLHPIEAALNLPGSQLLVLNHVSGDLSVVSTDDRKVINTLAVGSLPQGLAVAPQADQLYVSDTVLDALDGSALRHTELRTGYGSVVRPVQVQVDPAAGRAYMVASNGIPGSNSGLIIYIVDLQSGAVTRDAVGGISTTDLAVDAQGQRIFSTAARFTWYRLIVNDARTLEQTAVVDLPRYPAALGYNPATRHVFVCLTYIPTTEQPPLPELLVLDSQGFGTVARITLPAIGEGAWDPYDITVDSARGYVYIADRSRGSVHVVQDATLPPPPSPTPTDTPTPWPTLTPEPPPSPTIIPSPGPACQLAVAPRFSAYWADDRDLPVYLGCPTGQAQSGPTAEQPFERGLMVWREADRSVLVLYNDGVWRSFADRWQEGMPEYSCQATPSPGLQQPKRGFGLLWCNEPGIKEGLGSALQEELGFTSEWQTFEHGQMVFLGGRLAVYALLDDGTFTEHVVW